VKKKTGRPSKFTQEIADSVCERIASGDSVRTICLDSDMPPMSTVFRWLAQIESFREQYARAREAQADLMAEEILAIADETEHDTIDTENGERPTNEWIARSRLRVDARKWLASKMAPKKYGDKLDLDATISGKAGAPAVQVQIVKSDGS
jgi:hypothetical protein